MSDSDSDASLSSRSSDRSYESSGEGEAVYVEGEFLPYQNEPLVEDGEVSEELRKFWGKDLKVKSTLLTGRPTSFLLYSLVYRGGGGRREDIHTIHTGLLSCTPLLFGPLIAWLRQRHECKFFMTMLHLYSTGHSQHNMLKTLTNSYEQIRSFANKNEVRVNEFIKIRNNEVTTSFLIHENEFVILNSW